MCNIKRLDDFADLWPGASFGPAHCVIDDANIDDHNIDAAIRSIEALLTGDRSNLTPEDALIGEACDWWRYHDAEELAATLEFLRAYRALPEEQRMEPGDSRCYDDEDESSNDA